MGLTDLSIVIVSYNVRQYLKECLQSVRGGCDGLSVEVYVVDNASHDGSADLVAKEFTDVRLIANSENLGTARAVNRVLPLVRGRYTLLLNPDTVVPQGALTRLVEIADRWPEVGLAGPLTRDAATGAPLSSFRSFPTWRTAFARYTLARPLLRWLPTGGWQPAFDQPTTCGQLIGACLLIRRELLEQVGGLDEGFFLYYDDTEYCRRAIRAGWKVLYTRETEVLHHQGKSTEQLSPDSIWLLYFKGLFRYLQGDKNTSSWLLGPVFKVLFFGKIVVQLFESAAKIVFYTAIKRQDKVAPHCGRLRRNTFLFREILGQRLFT